MKSLVIASHNPVKAEATLSGFRRTFPRVEFSLQMVNVPSGVSEQPISSFETFSGALNRARNARRALPECDFWVGIEGGIEEVENETAAFAWVVILSQDRVGKGRTGTFFLPPEVASLVRRGHELGTADDMVFKRSNSKQENGAIGILTGDVINRAQLYEMAVVLALVPFIHPELYPTS